MPDDLVPVFQSETLMEAKLLTDRLEAEGIRAFIDNTDTPFDGLTAADQFKTVRVLPQDHPRATEITTAFQAEHEPAEDD